ncbi:hypothetical protein MPOCJGCO_0879 [Methylobacterium trifolii]|uniref:Uncharacterized protein n=1 Tax=Methylobacterium trifolii TaxID=1003092 RepID=A0ABQ4TU91_9HYPH|nr:hypothetical protein MPOCJGCO_0879 [Methylobacterium trifolii]
MIRQRQNAHDVVRVEPGAPAPLRGRNVKKSLKIRRWVTTPLTMATSMIVAAMPTIYRPQSGGMCNS